MMIAAPPRKEKGRTANTPAAHLKADTSHSSATPPLAQAEKRVAIWLYCIGARSLAETQAKFDEHPLWR